MSDFWSRRRAAVEAEEAACDRAEAEARGAEAAARSGTDDELLEALGLPDPDALGPGDDVSAFMARAVPHHLRRRALRALWARDPRLANLDGLVDYGGDFTDAGLRAGAVATAWEVGRGLTRRLEALAGEDDAPPPGEEARGDAGPARARPVAGDVRGPDPGKAAPPEPDAGPPDAGGAGPTPLAVDRGPPEAEAATARQVADDAPADRDEAPAPPRRRMRFAFEEGAA